MQEIKIYKSTVVKIWCTSSEQCKTVNTKWRERGRCTRNWIIYIHTMVKLQVRAFSYASGLT